MLLYNIGSEEQELKSRELFRKVYICIQKVLALLYITGKWYGAKFPLVNAEFRFNGS